MIIYQGVTTPDFTNVEYQQEQSDWNQTNSAEKSYIKNKPTIPTVNNATLTVKKNGTSLGTFTSNASSDVEVNITVPTKTSDLNNDSGFITGYTETDPVFTASPAYGITSQDITDWNNKSDFSGSYDDLTDKPSIPAAANDATITVTQGGVTKGTFTLNQSSNYTVALDAGGGSSLNIVTLTQSQYDNLPSPDPDTLYLITDSIGWSEISGKPSFATVATSGSYTDLTDKPSIPAAANDATITVTQGGVTKGTFTLNQSSNYTLALDAGGSGGGIPTGYSEEIISFVNAAGNVFSKTFLVK